MKIFVFAVGGTGARVLRSLTMLMAAGCKLPKDTTIVPVILDYDLKNGDTTITGDVLNKYQIIRKTALKDVPCQEDYFFGAPIIRLDQIPVANGASPKIGKTFYVSVEGQDNTFGHYIGYDLLTKGETEDEDLSTTKELLNSLYNNDPKSPNKELHLKLNVGFKGNPNIGAMVFDHWIQSREFQFFEENIGKDDRVFIVSSIFGGTGAAGFPKLVQSIKSSAKTNVQNTKIGSAIVMPYFRFGDDEQSAITASIFNSKTKAALSYYGTCGLNKDINAIYYLSDTVNQAEGTYNNVEGGAEQHNEAHIIELLAATSIIDFANREDEDLEETNRAYEFGLEKELEGRLNISHFHSTSQERYLDNLTKLTYFMQFYNKMLPDVPTNAAYAVGLDLSSTNLKANTFYKTLSDFFKAYKQWLDELEANTMRKFKAYDLDAPTHELLVHRKLEKKSFRATPLRDDFFHELMTKYHHEYHSNIPENEKLFLKIARKTMNETLAYANTH
jgi:hypothetical protein